MKYLTNRGEFATLAELRFAYLKSGEDQKLDPGHTGMDEWEPDKLHASEVGLCPRMQMLRITGAPKKIQNNLTQANEALMFWVAYRLHYLTYEAMQWAGILIDHEASVMGGKWAGRVDAIFTPDVNKPDERWLYDCKTSRPNAFKYSESFPKENHTLQMGSYFTSQRLVFISQAVIEYLDRGGSNIPVECIIGREQWEDPAQERMNALEQALEALPELPPMLTEDFVAHYRKAPNQDFKNLVSVTYDCSWECSWCKFHHTNPDDTTRPESPCKPPNHAPIEVAKKLPESKGGGWTFSPAAASLGGFEEWMSQQAKVVPVVGGES